MKRLVYLIVVVLLVMIFVQRGSVLAQTQGKKPLPQVPINYPGDTDNTIIRRAQWLEAAKKEGEVVWWGSASPNEIKAISREFNKIYPFITVNYWRGQNTERDSKLETDHAAGRVAVDIMGVGDPTHYPRWRKIGMPDRYVGIVPGLEKWDKRTYSKYGDWTMPEQTSLVPMYNTNRVSAAEAPRNWADLLDPKWKGKIGLTPDMKTWYMLALGEKGWGIEKTSDFLGKLKQQLPLWTADHPAGHNLLVAGEFSILVDDYWRYILNAKKKGMPVEWCRVSPVPVAGSFYMLPTKAPHPNAVRLFYEWFLSPQGLATIDRVTGKGSTYAGAGTRQAKALEGLELVYRTEEMIVKAADLALTNKFAKILGVAAE